jgi:hypothetical protein
VKRLVINADDFGMCHAVNSGVIQAFTEGIVTQASIMVPCPWFDEAVILAKQHHLPIGVHLTATCEWPHYRWGALTRGRSLDRGDGSFHATVAAARAACDPLELEAEFSAQIERVLAHGIEPQHLDVHMGVISTPAYLNVCRKFDILSLAPARELESGWDLGFPFTSTPGAPGSPLRYISESSYTAKKSEFLDYLGELDEGVHYNACHPAVDGTELVAMAAAEDPGRPWARDIRVSDLELLTDPDVRSRLDALGITLVSCGAHPRRSREREMAAADPFRHQIAEASAPLTTLRGIGE